METNRESKWNVVLSEEPFWLLEAVLCLNWSDVLDDGEWVEKGNGWPRAEREAFLEPYRRYREAMRERLEPVFARFPKLWGYIDRSPRKRESLNTRREPVLVEFLPQMRKVLEADSALAGEEWSRKLNDVFERMLDTAGQRSADAPEPEIHGLEDVLRILEGWDANDADKFQYVRLYSEAAEVAAQLRSVRRECREAGVSCLPLVRERYDAWQERMREEDSLSEILLGRVGIKRWDGRVNCRVWPMVLRFDGIRFQGREIRESENAADAAGDNEVEVHFGIEVFDLLDRKEKAPYDDTQLLARLKAVGDPTRMNILHLLSERPYYLQELAKELELTPATVSHHMGILITEELIGLLVTGGKKRVYYQVQKETLRDVGRQVERLALSREERKGETVW